MSFNVNSVLKSMILASVFTVVSPMMTVQAADVSGVEQKFQTRANVRMKEAIRIAESYFPGGKSIKVELESRYDGGIYTVELAYSNGYTIDAWVDSEKGSVIGEMHGVVPEFVRKINKEWHSKVSRNIYIDLEESLVKAEQETGYNAIRADYDYNSGNDYYEVDMRDNLGFEHEIHIDVKKTN